ncbi:single-stranded DNA-binding protein [Mycoplasmopsis cynos]|nr:single-stranded DNA-binding protein [Mycoplasmopsis cynos]
MINKVILIGRITQDIELTFTKQGRPYARTSLAVERKRLSANSERQTDFIPIVLWGTTAEFMSKYSRKGSLIYVEGELHINQYTNQLNQLQRSTDVTVLECKILESKTLIEQRSHSYKPQTQNYNQGATKNVQSNNNETSHIVESEKTNTQEPETNNLYEFEELAFVEDGSGLFENED